MEFVLYYKGPLSSNGDKRHKHSIRMHFAPQMQTLWSQDPLKTLWEFKYSTDRSHFIKEIEGYKYVPLVSKYLRLAAKLDITFLRKEPPGRVVHGGDIDNRIKTLFDALRMPQDKNELVETADGGASDLKYCLLEDDALVTTLSINTHQLLEKGESDDVILLIKVNTVILSMTYDNMAI